VCVCVCMCIPPIIATQRLSKHVPVATNTHATMETFMDASFFYAVHVVSKESRRLRLLRTFCFKIRIYRLEKDVKALIGFLFIGEMLRSYRQIVCDLRATG
jgi:hypothetical protein